jgi:acyl-[acyl carrier protein]--UDP-N-acetylglucosamine O-acyltransferase
MTPNGTVENTVASVNGQVVMVKYNGGEQEIIIGPDATIRRYVPGTKDELKPGAQVSVVRPGKRPMARFNRAHQCRHRQLVP